MKKLLLLATILISGLGFAQKIKVSEIDKFTKQRKVQTSFEKIVSGGNLLGGSGGGLMKNIWVAFELSNQGNKYLRLKWMTNDVLALSKDAKIILLDDKGNTYDFLANSFTIAGAGEGSVGFYGSALYGLNIYADGDIEALKGKKFTDLRINTTDGYMDFKIEPKNQNVVSDTYIVFEKELNK